MILATQSLDELKKSDILNLILENCSTKIFLANPDMDRLYQGLPSERQETLSSPSSSQRKRLQSRNPR
jgi:type IV secretory pathway VirB4 component